MNKKVILIVSILLIVVFVTLSGCTPEGGDETGPAYTSYDLIKDGQCDYTIVVPSNQTEHEKMARDEFIVLFKKATNITLPYISDEGTLQHSANAKYISIGETSLLASSGLQINKEQLGYDGARIITKDQTVYLVGGRGYGTLYAVYDFMTQCFGYEQYFSDCMEIETNVANKKLIAFDYTDIPDIPTRGLNCGIYYGLSSYDAKMFAYRMRMDRERAPYCMPIFKDFSYNSSSATSTNADYYLPYNTYYESHPLWFSDNCGSGEYQFCYTAHGDAQELESMVEECALKIRFSMLKYDKDNYPEKNVVTLTMQDNFKFCTCSNCTENSQKYGTDSGSLIIFINKVAEKLEQWQQIATPEQDDMYSVTEDEARRHYIPDNCKRDDFHIIFFAYNNFENPPVKYNNESGKYEAVAPEVVCRDDVGVYLAILNNIEYQKAFEDEINEIGKMQLDGWSELTDFLYYWTYETNFRNYMYYYDSFNYFTDSMYKHMNTKGVEMFFAQDQLSCGEYGSGWLNLKAYLSAKLSWDTSLSSETLTENWFNAMFKEAAPRMKELFYSMRIYYEDLMNTNEMYQIRSNYLVLDKKDYWNLATLQSWVATCDKAKEDVDKYKYTDPELYESICKHIEAEAFNSLFQILTLHHDDLSSTYRNQIYDRLCQDIIDLNLGTKTIAEHNLTVSEYIKQYK